jgi:hypothetical protein
MPPEDACEQDMLVQIRWEWRIAVPLSQLEIIDPDVSTKEVIGDWHGMRVVIWRDFNWAYAEAHRVHPDWFERNADSVPVRHSETPCLISV